MNEQKMFGFTLFLKIDLKFRLKKSERYGGLYMTHTLIHFFYNIIVDSQVMLPVMSITVDPQVMPLVTFITVDSQVMLLVTFITVDSQFMPLVTFITVD